MPNTYWNFLTFDKWDTLTESGWWEMPLDATPSIDGAILAGYVSGIADLSGTLWVNNNIFGISYGSTKYEDLSLYSPTYTSIYDRLDTSSGYQLNTPLISNTSIPIGRLYTDKGTDFFGDSFTHYFDLKYKLGANTYGVCDVWAVSNNIADEYSWQSNHNEAVRLSLNSSKLSLRSHENSSQYNSTYVLVSGVQYSVKVSRVSTNLSAYLYDNILYSGSPLTSLSVTLPVSRKYRYFWVLNKPNYGSSDLGRVEYTSQNYDLSEDIYGTLDGSVGFWGNTSGVGMVVGFLNLYEALSGVVSGSGIVGIGGTGGQLSFSFGSGLPMYIQGGSTISSGIPLFISGVYPTVGGSLDLYIGCSGVYDHLYLYIRGYGKNAGYTPFEGGIPLFIGNPSSIYFYDDLPLYLHCALGSVTGYLPLYIYSGASMSSGLDLYTTGGYTGSSEVPLYTHGY